MDKDYYIPLALAAKVLNERKSMRSKVESWWLEQGLGLPSLPAGDLGVLARQIASYRYEDVLFLDLARTAGLQPLWLELTSDRMSTNSNYKKSLLHPVYYHRRGRNGGMVTTKQKLTELMPWVGKRLSDVVLSDGQNLVEYHHNRFDQVFGAHSRIDNSQWINGKRVQEYYPVFLSLFLAHCVLFEDYHGGESGDKLNSLTILVFEPTFEQLRKRFGVGPLIVKMPWVQELKLYPPDQNWREHGVIPQDLMEQP